MKGKWRIVEMPDYETGFLDTMGPANIAFDGKGSGAFAFGCTHGCCQADLQPDGSLQGEICFHNGDEISFIARPWQTSSTAC